MRALPTISKNVHPVAVYHVPMALSVTTMVPNSQRRGVSAGHCLGSPYLDGPNPYSRQTALVTRGSSVQRSSKNGPCTVLGLAGVSPSALIAGAWLLDDILVVVHDAGGLNIESPLGQKRWCNGNETVYMELTRCPHTRVSPQAACNPAL